MEIIRWKNYHILHLAELDNQHKVWIGLLNYLYLMPRNSVSEKKNTLDFLTLVEVFLKNHIQFEERLIRRNEVSDSSEHVKLHQSLLKSVSEFSGQIEKDKEFLCQEITNDLITDHIIHHDRKIAESLQQGKLFLF